MLPELTDLPAMQVTDASHSVQLAVARAGDRLVSVGEQGIVLLSDDHGASWHQSSAVPVSVTLTDVEFISDTEGWAVGHSGVVLKTEDAGEQWVRVMTGKDLMTQIQSAVEALPDSFPDARIIKRNAGYLTGDEPILDVYFSESGEGWLLGAYGLALRSQDGGQTWQSAFAVTGNPNSNHLYQFVPSTAASSLIVGERGVVAGEVGDSGTYVALPIDYQGTFFGGVALGSEEYVLYGLRGNVWRGQGENWVQLDIGSQASISAAVATSRGIVLGDVSGRLFVLLEHADSIRELAITSDAAITDLVMSSQGELVMATARGLKRVNLDNTEFK
ncbi:YCF48-related protein [Marinobacter sp.]|uniref:WD40/YVTN/BNR-like repeat-containing protein n=1 Tax=Marinobacter sp. TaxID=50741 RepID=UPI0019B82421|nr:YCF48-related protein [Marinobacter sp.]MBD3654944.1 hypothetical protein [Marinobacter sp.]